MFYKKYLVIIPGIVLAFVLYTLSQGFNNIIGIELMGYTKSPISTAMIAILLGMFFGNMTFFNLDFKRKWGPGPFWCPIWVEIPCKTAVFLLPVSPMATPFI